MQSKFTVKFINSRHRRYMIKTVMADDMCDAFQKIQILKEHLGDSWKIIEVVDDSEIVA